MKIAIHTGDLDHERIDGTRVYIHNLLKRFGEISPKDFFLLYHREKYNPELEPPKFSNYKFQVPGFPLMWTQTAFAWSVWCDKPDVLWMPMHNLPFLRRKNLQTVVTIHDLAFKKFPEYFPKKDLRKLNFLVDYAIKHADRLIAVSQSTKNDILELYPERREDSIKVIYHGFDSELFNRDENQKKDSNHIYSKFKIHNSKFILYVGAIQPRKNLSVLIEAFEKIKKEKPDLKLVLAGQKAWLWEDVIRRIVDSPQKKDIIITGTISFAERNALYRSAAVFVFPSLYEGFGIPILEAFASGVPVICARNSSLTEVGGDAAMYFETQSVNDLYKKLSQVLSESQIRKEMIEKGKKRLESFSWKKSAKETLDWLKY